MATMNDEKKRQLVKLIGPDLASKILAAATATEKAADAAGIAFKERKAASAPFASPPTYSTPGWTGIGDVMGRK